MRDAKYYLTIEKQERQPHELPSTEFNRRARCSRERTRNKTQDSREIFHYAPLNGSFAKRMVQVPNRIRTMCADLATLAVDPCAKRRLWGNMFFIPPKTSWQWWNKWLWRVKLCQNLSCYINFQERMEVLCARCRIPSKGVWSKQTADNMFIRACWCRKEHCS